MTTPATGTQVKPRQRPWLKRWAFVFAMWLIASAVLHWMQKPTRLEVGQIVDKAGHYKFPNHYCSIEVRDTGDGWITFTTRPPVPLWRRLVPWSRAGEVSYVEKQRDWFFTGDDYARIWKFVGEWDTAWGERPKHPSGGLKVLYPTVGMAGPTILTSGNPPRVVYGWISVSSEGEWSGVPPEFFNRLPRNSKWYPHAWDIPNTPPPLPPRHGFLLEQATAKWRD